MLSEMTAISFSGLMGFGANCYLIKTGQGFILVDTAFAPKRAGLEKRLASAGCMPGDLKLIILTHGHGDHIGNAAHLRRMFSAPIAMHRGDSQMVETTVRNYTWFDRMALGFLSFIAGLGEVENFRPDVYLEEGENLSAYGWEALVVHLPGHSDGSIGILTASGDLFCGDVFVNGLKPARHSIVANESAFRASTDKLKRIPAHIVYPGHGKPFLLESWKEKSQ